MANIRRNDKLVNVAHCRVSYVDISGIRHEVKLEAETLYEAVAQAVSRFRSEEWAEFPSSAACEFRVEVQPAAPSIHTIRLSAVEQFAQYGTVKGPKDVLRKERIRAWLGVT